MLLKDNVVNTNDPILIILLLKLIKKISNKEIQNDNLSLYQYESQKQICSLITILNLNLFNSKIQKNIFDSSNTDIIAIYKKISVYLKNNKNYDKTLVDFFSINSKLFEIKIIKKIWNLILENQNELKFNSLSEMYSSLLTTFLDYELTFINNN